MANLSHTSGSDTDDLYPRSYNASAKNNLNNAPDNLNPYYACTTGIFLPDSEPNLGPAVVHIFSQQGTERYVLFISHTCVDKPLGFAIIRS